MIKEYIGSIGNRHNLTKYTLTNGVEVILNEQEEQELFVDTETYNNMFYTISDLENMVDDLEGDIISLRNQNEVLETKLEKYKETIKSFKEFQEQMSKLKV